MVAAVLNPGVLDPLLTLPGVGALCCSPPRPTRLCTTNLTGSPASLMALTATVWSDVTSGTPLISSSLSPVKS